MSVILKFRNDNNDWKDKHLIDICNIRKGKQLNKVDMDDTGEYYVLNGGILPSGNTNKYNRTENTISVSEGGNSCGYISYNKSKFWSGGHNYTLDNVSEDVTCVYQFLKAKESEIMRLMVGSGLPNIQKDRLGEVTLYIPSLDVQKQIATLLSDIDNKIEAQTKKLDKLKQVKSAMLVKMFPQEGQKVPKIRFKGFSGDWEEKRIIDVATIVTGGTPSTLINDYWYPKEVFWLASGEVHKKFIMNTNEKISFIGLNNSSAKVINKGAVLIALAGQGKTRGTVAINCIDLAINQSIAAMLFNNYASEFVLYNLESRYDELRKISSGDGSRSGLNKKLVGDIIIPYTSSQEQQLIGNYFKTLDDKISLEQEKLDKLSKIKSYLLAKLIPTVGGGKASLVFNAPGVVWCKIKLKDFLEEVVEKASENDKSKLLSSTKSGVYKATEYFDEKKEQNTFGYKILRKGQLVFSPQNIWMGNININDKYDMGYVSPSYKIMNIDESLVLIDYFKYLIKTEDMLNAYVLSSEQGASVVRRNLNQELFNDIEVLIPVIKLGDVNSAR